MGEAKYIISALETAQINHKYMESSFLIIIIIVALWTLLHFISVSNSWGFVVF